MEEKTDIKSLLPEELEDAMLALDAPKYRARQIFQWLMRGVVSFDEMTNLPVSLRKQLNEKFKITSPEIRKKQVSRVDGTVKYLWGLGDGQAIESVIMRYRYGNTLCVSSQVGCRMGCAFCASTIGGRIRNLTASEMLDQVLFAEIDSGLKISHIVMMGIGEPLDNLDQVVRFLMLVHDPAGLNISLRHITISTCGITDRIPDLAALNLPLTLTLSLHAPDDETRARIMPVSRRYPLGPLMDSCRSYVQTTGRRMSFEYAMIRDVNDSPGQAKALAKLLSGMLCHVNLIPLNEVAESPLHPSRPETIQRFQTILTDQDINTTVRRRLGPDIQASCGQLRRSVMTEKRLHDY